MMQTASIQAEFKANISETVCEACARDGLPPVPKD
jgi:hypothetical protein